MTQQTVLMLQASCVPLAGSPVLRLLARMLTASDCNIRHMTC